MLIQFKIVADDSDFFIDTAQMRWARTNGSEDKSEILELGKLIFVGMQGVIRIFALEGRSTATEGPGAGICTFGYATIDLDTLLTFYVTCNVPIKDLTSKRPIDTVQYKLIPTGENLNEEAQHQRPSLAEESSLSGDVSGSAAQEQQSTPEADVQLHD